MLIIALVLALIGLAALVFAVVTGNELVAWVCIGASVLGVVLLIIDALQERQRRQVSTSANKPASTEGAKPRLEEVTVNYHQVSSAGDTETHENSDTEHPDAAADEGDEAVTGGVGTGQRPAQSADSGSDDEE